LLPIEKPISFIFVPPTSAFCVHALHWAKRIADCGFMIAD